VSVRTTKAVAGDVGISDAEMARIFQRTPKISHAHRSRMDRAFVRLCVATSMLSVAILFVLIGSILFLGLRAIDWEFLSSFPASSPEEAGIGPALAGSAALTFLCSLFTLPLGIGTAIFLEEYRPKSRWLMRLHSLVQLNIANLAGVPSVVYGLIGLTAFAYMFGLFGTGGAPGAEIGIRYYGQMYNADRSALLFIPADDATSAGQAPAEGTQALLNDKRNGQSVAIHVVEKRSQIPSDPELRSRTVLAGREPGVTTDTSWWYVRFPFGRSILAGSLTLMLVVLPVVIVASQEALRAVPYSLREGAFGMGATRWQTVWSVTLPSAMPGMMTGSILAMGRAIGEAAPLLILSGTVFISYYPGNLMDQFSALPLTVHDWTSRPFNQGFVPLAAGAILVLLALLLVMNSIAIFVRWRFQRRLS
jgi:phosphate transport system permease protein